jgi:hypothetical protein
MTKQVPAGVLSTGDHRATSASTSQEASASEIKSVTIHPVTALELRGYDERFLAWHQSAMSAAPNAQGFGESTFGIAAARIALIKLLNLNEIDLMQMEDDDWAVTETIRADPVSVCSDSGLNHDRAQSTKPTCC